MNKLGINLYESRFIKENFHDYEFDRQKILEVDCSAKLHDNKLN